jgi:hypothetical protein
MLHAAVKMTAKINARLNEHSKIWHLFRQLTHKLVPKNVDIAVVILILSHLGPTYKCFRFGGRHLGLHASKYTK